MANYVLSYVPESDLRQGHNGLSKVAARLKRPVSGLKQGEFLLFVNRSQTAFKMLTTGNVMIHVKSERGKLDFDAVNLLPKYFNGSRFNYDGALRESLRKRLRKRK